MNKVAVCVSGLPRGKYQVNVERLERYFPFDFFFATWTGEDVEYDCQYFDPPEMHYNPGFEFVGEQPINFKNKGEMARAKKKPNLWLHRTKQILIHSWLVKSLPSEYDMIIRARFDSIINEDQDWNVIKRLIRHSYEKSVPVGIHTQKSATKNLLNTFKKLKPNHARSQEMLSDHMIFHPRDMLNHGLVDMLHREKRLIGAEYGWYQVLSKPFSDDIKNPRHVTYNGFCGVKEEK